MTSNADDPDAALIEACRRVIEAHRAIVELAGGTMPRGFATTDEMKRLYAASSKAQTELRDAPEPVGWAGCGAMAALALALEESDPDNTELPLWLGLGVCRFVTDWAP